MKCYFITATGTDIGKTFLCSNLIRLLRKQSYQVKALKPIISGFDISDAQNYLAGDNGQILDALGQDLSIENLQRISPFSFTYPASPDIAARHAAKPYLDYHKILELCQDFIVNQDADFAFIEGVGGVMVPINQQKLISDLIKDLQIEIILVTGNYLGTLSHSLTALNALDGQNIPHVIFNDINDNPTSLAENITSLSNFYSGNIHKLHHDKHVEFTSSLEKLAQML
jgi:dethiobiotin synthetase